MFEVWSDQIQILIITLKPFMSKYKMPILIHTDRLKQMQKKIQKYKLPILKDEPLQQHQYSISSSCSNIMKIQKLKYQSLNHNDQPHSIQKSSSRYDRVQKQQNGRQSAHEISYLNRLNSEENRSTLRRDQRIATSLQSNSNQNKYSSNRQYTNNKIKRQQSSSLHRYAEEDVAIGDLEQQIEHDLITFSNQIQKNVNKLPTIRQRTQEKAKKAKTQNYVQLWQQIFKELEQYRRPQKRKKKSKNRSNFKRARTELKKSYDIQSESQCKQIEKSLKNAKSVAYQYPPYVSLSQNFKEKNGSLSKQQNLKNESSSDSQNIENAKIIIGNIRKKSQQFKPSISFYMNSYQQIKIINPFFRKLNQLGGCILLNIGKLMIIESNKKLFSQGQSISALYIIIYGKVNLTDRHKINKKIALTGQTLGEESLFQIDKPYNERLKSGQKQYAHKYQGKVVNKSCLLALELSRYYKIGRELNKMGYKQLFNLIDNLFRINYISKQNSINSNRTKLQTEI